MAKYDESSTTFIGSGGFARVESITRNWDQKRLARKVVNFDIKANDPGRHIKREYTIQSGLRHPNIARYIDVQWRDGQVNYYMELFEDGSLGNMIDEKRKASGAKTTAGGSSRSRSLRAGQGPENALPVDDVWAIVYQLSSAVAYCHDPHRTMHGGKDSEDGESKLTGKVVFHRDIKPQNVLWNSQAHGSLEEFKLCDFGGGFIEDGAKDPTTFVGTDQYQAPEISRNKSEWTSKCDIFSLGCTLYEVCNFEPPFPDHLEGETEADMFPTISESYEDRELRDLIGQCISYDPDERPEAAELFALARTKLEKSKTYRHALRHQLLLEAVETGSLEEVERQIEEHPDLTTLIDASGQTPLHRAVQCQQAAIVDRLIRKGLSAVAETNDRQTPLHMALESGNDQITELLVRSCTKEDTELWTRLDHRGWALPHMATAFNNQLMLEQFFFVRPGWYDLTDGKSWSLLHIAASNGHVELLKFLLDRDDMSSNTRRAMIESSRSDGGTPLFAAAERGQVSTLKLLIQKGANSNVRANVRVSPTETRTGVTPLHVAALEGHAEAIEALLNFSSAKKTAKTNHNETALHFAVLQPNDRSDQVITLLKPHLDLEATCSALINETLQEGCTALHIAASTGNAKAAAVLIKLGAKRNAQTMKSNTPLHLAAQNGNQAIVGLLLDEMAKAGTYNRAKFTALHLALDSARNGSASMDAILATVSLMIEKLGPGILGQKTGTGDLALHIAAEADRLGLFKVVFEGDPKKRDETNHKGETALHIAAREDRVKIVRYLVRDKGARRDVKDDKGKTPIEVAKGEARAFLQNYG